MTKHLSLSANRSDYFFITNDSSSLAVFLLPPTQKLRGLIIRFSLLLDSVQPWTKFCFLKYSLELPAQSQIL